MSRTRTKRKRLGIPATLIVAAALIASGTWAWYDFTQSYSNTFIATSEADYDPILIDEFIDSDRDYEGWVLNEDVPKLVYVTYDHEDPLYEQYGGHPEADEDPANWKATYVRVYFTETLIVHDMDAGESHQSGPTIYKGTEVSCVEWTLGATVKTVAQWKAEWAVTPSAMNGPFWIMDTDGWFYWAEPLRHGESTDPLLESVKLIYVDDNEEIDYFIDVQMEAIDFGLRDFDKWRDPMESTNPTMGIGIRPLFGLTDYGIDEDGNTILMPVTQRAYNMAFTVLLDGINIYAGGMNIYGQLSDGTFTNRTTPVQMMWDEATPMTLRNVKDLRQSYTSAYILKPDGTWWAVGNNTSGQLSDGVTVNEPFPVQMMWDPSTPMDETNVLDIKPGIYHVNILRSDGIWYAVGMNTYGQLSIGNYTHQAYPVPMLWSAGVPILDADLDEFCAGNYNEFLLKKADHNWYGVGQNANGQLSIGVMGHQTYPIAMKWDAGTPITETDLIVASGDYATWFLKPGGTYWVVGGNTYNELSDGTITNRSYPVQPLWEAGVPMTTANVQQIVVGQQNWFILKSDNNWYGQGMNNSGELARGAVDTGAVGRYPQPAMWDDSNPMTKANVQRIWAHHIMTQFQKPDGSWWAVGNNGNALLIDGTLVNKSYPVPMLWATGTQIGLPN